MELFKIKRDIPFMSYGKLTTFISLVTFIAAVFFLVTRGLNFSVEFTGGTVMEVQYQQGADVNKMRERLDTLKIGDVQVQALGTNKHIMIRLPNKEGVTSAQLSNQVMDLLKKDSPDVTLRQVEFIGPQVGEELVSNGLMALGFVVIGIIIYLSMRFEWRFAVSAIIANMHDIVIILGCFAFFQWEFSLTVLAGILAVLGYSVNESVVVFDRIRENFRKPAMRGHAVPEVIDNAITATMSRTIITHGSTEAMVVSMLVFGGAALHGFSMALTIGIVFGIYSSVLVASPLLLMFGLSRDNIGKEPKKKEEIVV
ncbi:TPA: protein translocase subunit SecF [Neisseria meningitidis]|jgi:protein translocase subunit secF|uniref:Protein-export membrane protein SecF n=9 Tax=Neisseria meningitidis TaxID=487 RepID=Q7DDM5_NEIMB|nr:MULTISPECIES: protein translocase subunit SecF [Neisseria]AJC62848.1 preprotein translocase subunit SecF [Neisseria meningitidis LNP21362]EGC52563.1 protein-export membrane protein SecF [Neisseria meningitidis OX99.30304]EOC13736.1 protein-export membrane protein SecF [Neisseria meningitidis 73696]EQD08200.1 protein-export membrane protein SecF [Neisseria meningitidis NM151]EQD14629.1 protein-export membrane protein SecF [Neisseria meningitidis NM0552]KER40288.1 protein-export membrane pro